MAREQVEFKYRVGDRTVTVKAFETVGPEDAYEVLFHGVLHRYVTGEDVTPNIGRDVKDALIKTNLVI